MKKIIEKIDETSKELIYKAPSKVEIEAAGFEILGGLLDSIVPALLQKDGRKSKKILDLFPTLKSKDSSKNEDDRSTYQKLLAAVDCVSGMSDSYALGRYRLLRGIELPRA